MSRADDLVADLGRHLVKELAPVLERHVDVASAVLDPGELGMMMIGAARTVSLTMIATTLGMVPENHREALFDHALKAFAAGLSDSKAKVLARVREEHAKRKQR